MHVCKINGIIIENRNIVQYLCRWSESTVYVWHLEPDAASWRLPSTILFSIVGGLSSLRLESAHLSVTNELLNSYNYSITSNWCVLKDLTQTDTNENDPPIVYRKTQIKPFFANIYTFYFFPRLVTELVEKKIRLGGVEFHIKRTINLEKSCSKQNQPFRKSLLFFQSHHISTYIHFYQSMAAHWNPWLFFTATPRFIRQEN